ncbi:MAG: DNA repair exonuclease [Thermodesulfobacteriota bacterium]
MASFRCLLPQDDRNAGDPRIVIDQSEREASFVPELTFIHAADVHLGRPFSGLDRSNPELAALFRKSSAEAWNRMVGVAVQRRVDFVVLAGDVFDGAHPSVRARVVFREGIEQLYHAGIPVFLALGNHDPLEKFPDALRKLPGLHLFAADPGPSRVERRDFTDGVRIYGASFERSVVKENLAAQFNRDPGVGVAVGVLHAHVSGLEGHEPYAPCTLDDLRGSGMDIWCLGHVHSRRILCEDPLILYSGTLQGAHIREGGPKGCSLVTVAGRHEATAEFFSVAPVRWESFDLPVREVDTVDDVIRSAEELCAMDGPEMSLHATVARFTVVGASEHLAQSLTSDPEAVELLAERLSQLPVPAFLESVTVATDISPALEALKRDEGLVGELLRECEDAGNDPLRLDELSQIVLKELRRHVSISYLPDHYRVNGSHRDVWRNLLREAGAVTGQMFLDWEP